jgi:hypothetical protein
MVEPFSRRLNVKLDCPVGSSVSTSSNSMYCEYRCKCRGEEGVRC